MASSSSAVHIANYAPQVASLFNNMKTPASILAGALVPIGFAATLPIKDERDNKYECALRKACWIITVLSFVSNLLSVMWASVAVNQVTETVLEPADSVWHLLERDFNLPWAAVNAHFVIGMLGFCYVIGTRAYFSVGGGPLGFSLGGIAFSALLLMISIVNRGVASGSGNGMRYGSCSTALVTNYMRLLLKRATARATFGPLELSSIGLMAVSIAVGIGAVCKTDEASSKKKSD